MPRPLRLTESVNLRLTPEVFGDYKRLADRMHMDTTVLIRLVVERCAEAMHVLVEQDGGLNALGAALVEAEAQAAALLDEVAADPDVRRVLSECSVAVADGAAAGA